MLWDVLTTIAENLALEGWPEVDLECPDILETAPHPSWYLDLETEDFEDGGAVAHYSIGETATISLWMIFNESDKPNDKTLQQHVYETARAVRELLHEKTRAGAFKYPEAGGFDVRVARALYKTRRGNPVAMARLVLQATAYD